QNFRERRASASLLNRCRLRIEYLQEPRLNFFTWLVEGAFGENESLRRFGTKVDHAAAHWKIAWMQLRILLQLSFERFPFLFLRAFQLGDDGLVVGNVFVRFRIEILFGLPGHLP